MFIFFLGVFYDDGLLSLCLIPDPLCVEKCTDDMGVVDPACVADCSLVVDPECEILPEEVGLFLDTMNANSFGFVYDDLAYSGVHSIDVKAQVATRTCSYAGDNAPDPCNAVIPDVGTAEATGSIGVDKFYFCPYISPGLYITF